MKEKPEFVRIVSGKSLPSTKESLSPKRPLSSLEKMHKSRSIAVARAYGWFKSEKSLKMRDIDMNNELQLIKQPEIKNKEENLKSYVDRSNL